MDLGAPHGHDDTLAFDVDGDVKDVNTDTEALDTDDEVDNEEVERSQKRKDIRAQLMQQIFVKLMQRADQQASASLWITYLRYLARKDMPKALGELARSQKALSEAERHVVEREWQAICRDLESGTSEKPLSETI